MSNETADKIIHVVAAAIWDGVGKILIGQRAENDSYPGVWEFVGGKQEENENLEEALHRELKEELGIEVQILKSLGHLDFSNSRHKFRLHMYFALWTRGVPEAFEHQSIEWIESLNEADRNWSSPDRPFLEPIARLIKEFV